MPPGFLSRLQESAEPRRSQPNQEGASASHRATEEETQPSRDVAQCLFLPFPEEKVMRPNPGNVQQPTLPRRIWRGATRGRAGGSGRLEDGASPSWAPRRGRGRALLTSRNSAELANEPGARTWATPWLAGAVVQGTCSGQLAASRACPAAPGTSGQRTGDGPRQAQWRGRGVCVRKCSRCS